MKSTSGFAARHVILLILITALFHLPSLYGGLFLDDGMNYLNSAQTPWNMTELCRGFKLDISRIHDGIIPGFMNHKVWFFRPLMVISMKLDQLFWGNSFHLYHLTSFMILLTTVLLVRRWALILSESPETAFLAAFLFVATPVNFFTSYWLSSRTDLLCGLFMMLSLVLISSAMARGQRFSFMSLLCFTLALCSKEATVTLPVMVPLIWLYLRFRERPAAPGEDTDSAQESSVLPLLKRFIPKALPQALMAAVPFFLVLGLYLPLRQWAVAGSGLPRIYFYLFPPEEPLFIVYALERLFLSLATLLVALPPSPIKMLFHLWPYHFMILTMALAAVWMIRRLWRGLVAEALDLQDFLTWKILFILLGLLWLLASLPTLPLFPAPHYHYVPSFFTSIAAALYISRRRRITPHWGRSYLAFIGIAGFCAASACSFFFGTVEVHGSALFKDMAALHKKHLKSLANEGITAKQRPTEFYLFDQDYYLAHARSELQVREHIKDFRVFLVDVSNPLSPPSRVSLFEDRVVLRSEADPFWSGIFVLFTCPDHYPFQEGEIFSCPWHSLKALNISKNGKTGLQGPKTLEILFPEGRSSREGRYFIHAHSSGPAIVLNPEKSRQSEIR